MSSSFSIGPRILDKLALERERVAELLQMWREWQEQVVTEHAGAVSHVKAEFARLHPTVRDPPQVYIAIPGREDVLKHWGLFEALARAPLHAATHDAQLLGEPVVYVRGGARELRMTLKDAVNRAPGRSGGAGGRARSPAGKRRK